MFDVSKISRRAFQVRLTSEIEETGEVKELIVNVEPPKIKMLKKIVSLMGTSRKNDDIDEACEAIRLMVSKNTEGVKVPIEFIDDLDMDEMKELMSAFFEWLNGVKNSKN